MGTFVSCRHPGIKLSDQEMFTHLLGLTRCVRDLQDHYGDKISSCPLTWDPVRASRAVALSEVEERYSATSTIVPAFIHVPFAFTECR